MRKFFLLTTFAIAWLCSCNKGKKGAPNVDNDTSVNMSFDTLEQLANGPVEDKWDTVARPIKLTRVYQNGDTLLQVYLTDKINWPELKDLLIKERKRAELEKGTKKIQAYLCVDDNVQMPVNIKYLNELFGQAYEPCRVCCLDNMSGTWMYYFGGTKTELGHNGEWKRMEKL